MRNRLNPSGRTLFQTWSFRLIAINVIIYLVQLFTSQFFVTYTLFGSKIDHPIITYFLGLIPSVIVERGFIWQIFTYMFLHGGFTHILFNMYALFFCGFYIESEWGSRKFVLYYLFCGTFAGLSIFLINTISQGAGYYIPTIGASGAVFGLLLAFAILFPDVEFLLFFIIPIKAKYFVIIYGSIELYFALSGGGGPVSHIGHLGGLAAGLIYFLLINRKALSFKRKIKKKFAGRMKSAGAMGDSQSAGINGKRRFIKKMAANISELKPKRDDNDSRAGKIKYDANDTEYQRSILDIVKQNGINALTDDQVQYIKYLEIMSEDDNNLLCSEEDFNINDDHCKNCENFRACFIRELKKYL